MSVVEARRHRPVVYAPLRGVSRGEWLRLRQNGIGGSDAGAVLGVNRYRSAFDVWRSKVEPVDESETAGEAARWGTLLEPLVAEEFRRTTGFRVHRLPVMLQHPDYPWMLADVDRVIRSPEGVGILEVKTASAFKMKEWAEGRVPDSYWVQVQHYLAVTGFGYGYVAVLIGGQRFLPPVRVERDEAFIRNLCEAEENFWVTVEVREPPALDGSEAASEYLRERHPRAVEETVNLPPEASALVDRFVRASAEEAEAKRLKGEAKNRLKAMLGDAERGIVGDDEVTWRNVTTRRFQQKAFEAAHPRLFKRFSTEQTTRKFDVRRGERSA